MPIWDGSHRRARFVLSGRRDVVVPTIVEVKSFDELGRPKECTILYDEEVIDIEKSSRAFWIIYMGERDVMKAPKSRA